MAKILEYQDTTQAIRKNVDEDDKMIPFERGVNQTPPLNMQPNTVFINESGLYSLIFKSRLPAAKQFKKWVTRQILPSIRKTGKYILQNQIDNLNDQIQDLGDQIRRIRVDVISKPINERFLHTFTLLKTNDPESYDYYVIRCQRINRLKMINRLLRKHPYGEIFMELEYNPNSISLFNKIKEELNTYLCFHGNYFDIINPQEYLEINLLNDIYKLCVPVQFHFF